MEFVICILLGYLIGTVNPSYIMARIRGFDIRKRGSGNAGASNAVITLGRVWGITFAFLDILKAFGVILLAEVLFPQFPYAFALTGVACILGHIFPFYMKFKGGKGLACLGGMILYFDWRVFLVFLGVELIIALATDYICFVPITASVVFPVVYGCLTKNWIGAAILLLATAVMLGKHMENIRRIRNKAEMRLSYLWRPDREIERMKRNAGMDEEGK